ncbi:protein-(glutamine-N5) methyltransferase, release factor-specific [Rivularia sp. PCC 7116]|uniref:peptide chain release factor N(5)-glutamine methyltransferase n=1 Tax=Rivularia sp. PCC 7116 TaxID=373994 RepID=UPI00029EEAF7|nr:peptide chain release factor N(5)-glutamine methyltransferase [Rivularia sp. PCC 7116]AFY54163.1 protein-(glutamine-N5) methyltransferase, release factor-specific [Rivularia sp. PCC 7116]
MADERQLQVSGIELSQWRDAAISAAASANVSCAEVDWLLQEVAGLDSLALRISSFKEKPQIQLKLPLQELSKLWQQRINENLPVQYIAKNTPWRHFNIKVSPSVLIPRPETESIIDLVTAATADNSKIIQGHWADLGTGSGIIALGLATALNEAIIHAVDSSAQALSMARINAENNGLSNRIKFYQGSWWEPLNFLKGEFSGMVSNPPYIPTNTLPKLQPEVFKHEPHLALDGGNDGLECIRHLVDTSSDYLKPGGIWLVEMMAGQADRVTQMLNSNGSYSKIEIHRDLAGIERFALAYKR